MSLLNLFFITYSFTLGLIPFHQVVLFDYKDYPTVTDFTTNMVSTDLDIQLEFKNFYVGGGTKTYSVPQGGKSFFAVQDSYTMRAGAKFKLKDINIDFGYEHNCQHMIANITESLPPHSDVGNDLIFINFNNRSWQEKRNEWGCD